MTNSRSPSHSCTSLSSSVQASSCKVLSTHSSHQRQGGTKGHHLARPAWKLPCSVQTSWEVADNEAVDCAGCCPSSQTLYSHFSSPRLLNHLPLMLHISKASIKYIHKPPVSSIPSGTGWGMSQMSNLLSAALGLISRPRKGNKTQLNLIPCLFDSIIWALEESHLPLLLLTHTLPQTAAAGQDFAEEIYTEKV